MQGEMDKALADKLLIGLSENYGAIYYVDFDENRIVPYRIYEAVDKLFGDYFRTNPTYEDAIGKYIDAIVSEKDKDEMYAVTRYEFLKEQLKDVRAYSHEYRVEREGREHVFRFKVAHLDEIGELHKVVMGFADVSAEKATDYDYYRSDRKILVVEDNKLNREVLVDILSDKYEVVSVQNGQEALDILDERYQEFALVMTDLNMPVMDGYQLIKKMKGIRQYSCIPIIVITGTGGDDIKARTSIELKCLELGAADFVVKPYNSDVVLNRVKGIINLRESMTFLHSLEKDSMTGLYTKEFFFRRVEQYLRDYPNENYVILVTDIIGLKVINENYGVEAGDEILKKLAEVRRNVKEFLLAGRTEGDKFAALIKETELEEVIAIINNLNDKMNFPVPNVTMKHGYYRIPASSNLQPQRMYDRALLALTKIKEVYGEYFAEYDDDLRQDLLNQRTISETAMDALKNNEFSIYFQPKIDVQSEMATGAEALIRWNSNKLGFMNPGTFIPIFEKNGFIKNLDYYVWKEVCKYLREWKSKGYKLVPISINISRRDFEDDDLAENLIAIADHYEIDHSLLHVEITESAYSENPQRISQTIRKIHDAGFTVELDDFGSGYSSMIALNELAIDVLKIDMSIVQQDNPDSDKSVLGFSMQLAKVLNLKTVAEGVETKLQADRIASLGGDYIQGYFYSKPLPKEEFTIYMQDK